MTTKAIEAGARAKAYVIIAGTGEYSGRSTWPAKVFLDRETATQTMAALEAVEKKFESILSPVKGYYERFEKEKELNPRAEEEYAAIGFADDGHIYDTNVDWRLEEAAIASGELVPVSAGQHTPLDWGKLVQCILRCMDATIKNESSREQAERIATAIEERFGTAPASETIGLAAATKDGERA